MSDATASTIPFVYVLPDQEQEVPSSPASDFRTPPRASSRAADYTPPAPFCRSWRLSRQAFEPPMSSPQPSPLMPAEQSKEEPETPGKSSEKKDEVGKSPGNSSECEVPATIPESKVEVAGSPGKDDKAKGRAKAKATAKGRAKARAQPKTLAKAQAKGAAKARAQPKGRAKAKARAQGAAKARARPLRRPAASRDRENEIALRHEYEDYVQYNRAYGAPVDSWPKLLGGT